MGFQRNAVDSSVSNWFCRVLLWHLGVAMLEGHRDALVAVYVYGV